jgi:hypothetical protein
LSWFVAFTKSEDVTTRTVPFPIHEAEETQDCPRLKIKNKTFNAETDIEKNAKKCFLVAFAGVNGHYGLLSA